MKPPFDHARLDELLTGAGVDALVATSPHNTSHLLGGYRYFLYDVADSIGLSRYLPAVAYHRGAPVHTMYVGAGNEDWSADIHPLWVPDVRNVSWGTVPTAQLLVEWCRDRTGPQCRMAIEMAYLPSDAYAVLHEAQVDLVDGSELLEDLRAVKRPHELDLIRQSSAAVVDAMLATFGSSRIGDSKRDVAEVLRRNQTDRGLTFCYALVAAGSSINRAPSDQRLGRGDVLSLDSGAMFDGWVADVTRMGIAGEPTARHHEVLEQVDLVQQAVLNAALPGKRGEISSRRPA